MHMYLRKNIKYNIMSRVDIEYLKRMIQVNMNIRELRGCDWRN